MSNERHSVALPGDAGDARLFAPAAARNMEAIITALVPFLPATGTALEIASGTGEHVVRLAAASPGLVWQPTDIDADRLASIAAWIVHEQVANVRAPQAYDALEQPWPGAPADALFLSNLTHLIRQAEARALFAHMADALAPGGILALYGPFLRGSAYASEGDTRFDAAIRAERPGCGYKDIGWVEARLAGHGLARRKTIAMPANNLMTIWKRPA